MGIRISGAGNGMENPLPHSVQDRNLRISRTRPRLRQLPTNHNHASLCRFTGITREYQYDSPSQIALPWIPGFSRDGPKGTDVYLSWLITGLTGSFISVRGSLDGEMERLRGANFKCHLHLSDIPQKCFHASCLRNKNS